MKTFRLLHLSDFHIAVRDRKIGVEALGWSDWWSKLANIKSLFPTGYLSATSSHDKELANSVARFAWKMGDELDAILVTGDLATTGDWADLCTAFEFVDSPPFVPLEPAAAPTPVDPFGPQPAPWLNAYRRPTIRAAGTRILLLPGNHDRFDGWLKNAGGQHFDQIFQSYWPRDKRVNLSVLELEEEKLAIIAADFTLAHNKQADETSWGYLGQGKVHRDVVKALRHKTLACRKEHGAVAIIWAVHFPPLFTGILPQLRLLEEERLVTSAKRLGIKHLFCGHTHEPREYKIDQTNVWVHCAGASMQYYAPPPHLNSIHPVEIDVERGKIKGVRWRHLVWSSKDQSFV